MAAKGLKHSSSHLRFVLQQYANWFLIYIYILLCVWYNLFSRKYSITVNNNNTYYFSATFQNSWMQVTNKTDYYYY